MDEKKLAQVIEELHARLAIEERLTSFIIAMLAQSHASVGSLVDQIQAIEPEDWATNPEWFRTMRDKRVEILRNAIEIGKKAK